MSSPRESWRAVRRDPRYKVSSLGRVRSVPRVLADGRAHGGQLLTPVPDKDGYLRVNIAGVMMAVHAVVLEAFRGPCPPGMEGCHGPGGKLVNTAAALRWDTHAANERDKRLFAAAESEPEGHIWPEGERPSLVVTPVASGAAGA